VSADAVEVTADFESWLARHLDVVPAGLAEKHRVLARGELSFLRGTYYLWLLRVAERAPEVLRRAAVPAVGDLHVENFGTWRDRDQVRRWGVNDLDELARGAWLLDLLRLATSAAVSPHVHLGHHEIAEELLTTYAACEPGVAVDIADHDAHHLAALVPVLADRDTFYAGLAAGTPTSVPPDVARAAATVAEAGWRPTWHQHEVGTGSLGHRRAVGVGPAADGSPHAREAKQLGPGTALWAADRIEHPPVPDPSLYGRVHDAVLGPAGATRVEEWQVRDLAPDVVRIELSGLPRHDARRLLRSMARATADVHGSDPEAGRAAQAEARTVDVEDLAGLVAEMVAVTGADLAAWRDHLTGSA
jgi:hypothetical protein